jgi:hypothetical protein
MARKSKDPRKPSQAYLAATGQLKPTEASASTAEPSTMVGNNIAPLRPTGKDSSQQVDGLNKDQDLLRQEIRALGGNDEDWEMLKDLSDSEEEFDGNVIKNTKGKAREIPVEDVGINSLGIFTSD